MQDTSTPKIGSGNLEKLSSLLVTKVFEAVIKHLPKTEGQIQIIFLVSSPRHLMKAMSFLLSDTRKRGGE